MRKIILSLLCLIGFAAQAQIWSGTQVQISQFGRLKKLTVKPATPVTGFGIWYNLNDSLHFENPTKDWNLGKMVYKDSLSFYLLKSDTTYFLHESDLQGIRDSISGLIVGNYDDKSMTGFLHGSSIDVSYSHTDRKITLTGDLSYYWKGIKKTLTSPWTSSAHDATVGKWYLASTDGATFTWSQNLWTFDIMQVSYLYYKATEAATFAGREVHELMDWETHKELHLNIGTWLASGGTLKAGTYQENSAVNADITPGFNTAVVTDEDLSSTITEWAEGTYTTMSVNGATSTYNIAASYPFTVSTGTYINYNNPLTGAWVEGGNNKYYNVYQVLVPVASSANSQKYRMIMLQPQREHASLTAAQTETTGSLYLGDLTVLAPEFKIYARITYLAESGSTSHGKVKIPIGGISYVLGSNASNVNVSGAVIASHPNLNLLGWDASGHTGTANTLSGFNANGAADYTLKSAYQAALNGSGFVKISGTTISYDNSTYLTTETDPVYAIDSAYIIHWADSVLFLATKHDLSSYSLTSHNHSGTYLTTETDPFHTAWLATDPVKDFSRSAGSAAYANIDAFSTFDHLHTGVYDPAGTGHTEATDHMTVHTGAFTHSNIHALHADDQDLSGYSLTSHNHSGTYLTTETDPIFAAWLATDPVKDFSRLAGSAAYANVDAFIQKESDPVYAIDSASIIHWADSVLFLATKHDLLSYSLTSHNHSGIYDPAGTGHTEATDHMTAHTNAFNHSLIHAPGSDNQDLSGYSLTSHNHTGIYSLITHDHAGVYSLTSHNHSGIYDPAGTGHTEATDHMTAHTNAFNHSNIHALHADDQDLSGYSLTSHNHSGTYLTTETDPIFAAWLATDPVTDLTMKLGAAAYAELSAFIPPTGGTFTGDVIFNDTKKVAFGSSGTSDSYIYWNDALYYLSSNYHTFMGIGSTPQFNSNPLGFNIPLGKTYQIEGVPLRTFDWDAALTDINQRLGSAAYAKVSDFAPAVPTVQPLSGTTPVLNVNNGKDATLPISGNTTFTLLNVPAGATGNVAVSCNATAYTLTFVFSGGTVIVNPNIYTSTGTVTTSAGATNHDCFSWWFDGTYLHINGSKNYL